MPHFLLSYELAPDYLERRGAFRDAHLALAWESVESGALLLFSDAEAARTFAEADPYVSEGLVRAWRVLPWATVVGHDAATPVRPS